MIQTLKTPLFTILFIFLGLFLYIKLFGAIPFSVTSVTTTKTNLFQASGTGKATAIPNTATLSLGVTKTSASVTTAQDQVNSAVNKIITDIKNLGIDEKDIKTTNYNVYPSYDYSSERQTITGYTVTQTLEIKTKPIDKANRTVDLATASGANIIGGITFTLDDIERKKLEDAARKEAVANAKEKAQSLASAAGILLGRIIDVQESDARPPITFRTMEQQAAPSEDQTILPTGENVIEITVTLSYETR